MRRGLLLLVVAFVTGLHVCSAQVFDRCPIKDQDYHAPKDTSINILFSTGSASLTPLARMQVRYISHLLHRDSLWYYTIALSGYADERGDRAMNMTLSSARVDSVRDLLYLSEHDTALHKFGCIDFMTHCVNVKWFGGQYAVPVYTQAYGKTLATDYDSLRAVHERTVVVHLRDNRVMCLGTFDQCYLPAVNKEFYPDSGMRIIIPIGGIDEFTVGTGLGGCPYDSFTDLKLRLLHNLPDTAEMCEAISKALQLPRPGEDALIGRLNFTVLVHDKTYPHICSDPTSKAAKCTVSFLRSLLPCDSFQLRDASGNGIVYTMSDGYINIQSTIGVVSDIRVYVPLPRYRKMKLLIKGKQDLSPATDIPGLPCQMMCELDKKKKPAKKKRQYEAVVFAQLNNTIRITAPATRHTTLVPLAEMKYKSQLKAYQVKRKTIRRLLRSK